MKDDEGGSLTAVLFFTLRGLRGLPKEVNCAWRRNVGQVRILQIEQRTARKRHDWLQRLPAKGRPERVPKKCFLREVQIVSKLNTIKQNYQSI